MENILVEYFSSTEGEEECCLVVFFREDKNVVVHSGYNSYHNNRVVVYSVLVYVCETHAGNNSLNKILKPNPLRRTPLYRVNDFSLRTEGIRSFSESESSITWPRAPVWMEPDRCNPLSSPGAS